MGIGDSWRERCSRGAAVFSGTMTTLSYSWERYSLGAERKPLRMTEAQKGRLRYFCPWLRCPNTTCGMPTYQAKHSCGSIHRFLETKEHFGGNETTHRNREVLGWVAAHRSGVEGAAELQVVASAAAALAAGCHRRARLAQAAHAAEHCLCKAAPRRRRAQMRPAPAQTLSHWPLHARCRQGACIWS